MRRQTLLTIPVTTDVCVFCATRQQFTATRPRTPLQRRFFRSTVPTQKPPAVAVAQRDEQTDNDAASRWRSEIPQRHSGGAWSANAAARDLTPEEQALRNVLQKGEPPPTPNRKFEKLHYPQNRQSREKGGFQLGHRDSHAHDSQHLGRRYAGKDSAVDGGGEDVRAQNRHFEEKVGRNLAGWDTHNSGASNKPGKRLKKKPLIRRLRYNPSDNADSDATPVRSHQATESRLAWNCPSCGFENFWRRVICNKCHLPRQSSITPVGQSSPHQASEINQPAALDHQTPQSYDTENGPKLETNRFDDEALRAEGWKHVRRRASSENEQSELKQEAGQMTASVSSESDNHAIARTAERGRNTRLENTKDGKFVGLHSGLKFRKLATEVTQRQPQVDQTDNDPGESALPTSEGSKTVQGWARWKASSSSDSGSEKPPEREEAAQHARLTNALKGWEYPIEQDSISVVSPQASAVTQTALPQESETRQPAKRSDLSFDPTFDEDSRQRRPERIERSRTQEPNIRARGSGIEVTSAPIDRNRHKERKSKRFVSAIDEFDEDDDVRAERWAQRKKQREKAKVAQKAAAPPTPIYLPEFISVSNLAGVLRVRVEDFIRKMKELGFEETNNDHVLDAETAGLVASEFNYEPIIERASDKDLLPLPPAKDKSILPPRPPVVTIMGHVDHGKTTLLDYLRKSSVAASEHGGITQHIGAFSVPMPGGRLVTFLDTPGHEAFLSMRKRGANVTDIVILVVAADDSVKPQTIEAIKHAQDAKVPMIVAVNKIDKEDSNVDRVKQDLARYGVEIEDYGGDTQIVCVSGKTGSGMAELEDAAVALADILDMRSEIDGQAEGWVLEATTKKAGRVATVLVRRGTIRPGDVIVAGTSWARVRSLRNEAGVMVPSAGPGTPVEIDGWREQPAAGDEVIQAPDEQKAKSVIDYRREASDRTKMAADMEAVNEARRLEQEKREQFEKAAELAEGNSDTPTNTQQQQEPQPTPAPPTFQEVFFIVKADVSGSVEAVTNSVSALGNSEVRPHILRSGIGPVTEFDVDHAAVAKGHIINFNTVIEGPIQRMAEANDVNIINQSIIYRLVDDVKATLGEKLKPKLTQKVLGEAEIAQVFEINTKGRVTVPIAGCRVRNGVIAKTAKVRVLREKEVVYDGSFSSLKNVKKDVTEMRKGNECGMGFENWTGFKVGDQVQTYEESVERRSL